MLNRRIAVAALSALLTIQAQEAGRKVFEAAAIKPNHTGDTDSSRGSPGRLTASFTARALIKNAFGVPDAQIVGGPPWIGSESWDITASTGDDTNTSPKNLEPYLQSLLEDRFAFRYHRETREMPVYSLVVAKGGVKMKAHEGGPGSSSNGNGSKMTATNLTAAQIATRLNRNVDRPVVDNTGLTSGFDFTLEWTRNPSPDSPEPSIFAAIQEQLGLKLEAGKGPADFIVIDNIERPTPN
jgi:uncharacterized protein (TIGR03435 family)